MRLGGNGNARSYFRKCGFTDLYGGKTDKKYKSKAAQSYKAELAKLVQAEAAKRGEGVSSSDATENANGGGSLLENLEVSDLKKQQQEAKLKLEAARTGGTGIGAAGVLQPKAKLASSLAGASKLLVKPSGTLGTLRKPTGGSSTLLKKKGGLSTSKIRVNKLSMKLPVKGNLGGMGAGDDNFEDIEETRKNAAEAEASAKQAAEEAVLAKKMREEMIINGGKSFEEPAVLEVKPVPVMAPAPVPVAVPKPVVAVPKKPTKDENLAKLKNMTSDFFAQM